MAQKRFQVEKNLRFKNNLGVKSLSQKNFFWLKLFTSKKMGSKTFGIKKSFQSKKIGGGSKVRDLVAWAIWSQHTKSWPPNVPKTLLNTYVISQPYYSISLQPGLKDKYAVRLKKLNANHSSPSSGFQKKNSKPDSPMVIKMEFTLKNGTKKIIGRLIVCLVFSAIEMSRI